MAGQRDTVLRGFDDLHAPTDVSVRAQLARILSSRVFCNAPSLSRFLRHLVHQTLEGNANQSKEYSIGILVFDRGESFDPRIDTIVRVQARRLRAKLAEYYASEGSADPILIEVPKGEYNALFRRSSPPASGANARLPIEIRPEFAGGGQRATGFGQFPLPVARTPLIGREIERLAIKRMLLDGEVRLVTLIGAGGSGKTRLAVQAASELIDDFPGGIWFVPLASILEPAMVASTIAQALAIRHTGGKPVALALREHVQLAIHAPALLVIDNFEHLLESAPLIGELLDASAILKILVTSREVLRVYGEHEFSVLPLPTPDLNRLPPISELCRNPSVELFVQRATAINPKFELTVDNSRAVAGICNRLDGLPLAIELAAARLRTLTPAGMLARLQHPLDLLTEGNRDVPARQQTLRNTIDWSYGLLNSNEQKLFRRLSVFAGGCTLESAEAVCDGHRDLDLDILAGVSSLLEKSLLQQREHSTTQSRFVMLETIREYALERLIESGEGDETRRVHAAYALVVAEERNTRLTPAELADWASLCDAEHDNFRAALDWLIETDRGEWAMRLGVALYHFWDAREHFAEGRERLQAILGLKSAAARTSIRAHAAFCAMNLAAVQRDYDAYFRLCLEALDIYRELGDQKGVASMLGAAGATFRMSGDLNAGRAWFEQALHAYRALGDRPRIAGSLSNLADIAGAQGNAGEARALFDEARSIFRELGDSASVAWTLNQLGDVAFRQGEWMEARQLYSQGAEMFRSLGDRRALARSLTDLGYVACELHEYETAHSLFMQALEALRELRHARGIAKVFEGCACLAVRERNFERALTLAGAASGLRNTLGASMRPDEMAKLETQFEPAWRHFDAVEAKAIWSGGARMRIDHAIRYALESPGALPLSAEATEN